MLAVVSRCSLLALASAVLGVSVSAQGSWAAGYAHPLNLPTNPPPAPWPTTSTATNFQAINLAVIPDTSKVIVWDSRSANQGTSAGQPWPQRFAVGDPVTGVFDNYVVPVPAGWGDLFCSGHCWLPNGKLFVAGGNTRYSPF